MDSSHAASTVTHAPGEGHATVQTYIRVAVVLGLPKHLLVTLLLVFSVIKFALVVAFFMHLRYDNKVLTALFVGPLLIAMIIILALMALFGSYLLLARG